MKKILYLLCFGALLSCTNNAAQKGTESPAQKPDARPTAETKTNTPIQAASNLVYGKYGCTASKYNNGSIEYIPRGYFTLSKNGEYTYDGFEKPSSGTFTVDKDGNLYFKGGYFDGGKAEKIDRPNKFFLIFPTIPDNRWTCGLVDVGK
jgi:hypothetical protein